MSSHFDEFLREQHAQNYHGTDDDMPDAFERWVEQLDTGELIEFADLAMLEARRNGIRHGGDIALKAIRESFGK